MFSDYISVSSLIFSVNEWIIAITVFWALWLAVIMKDEYPLILSLLDYDAKKSIRITLIFSIVLLFLHYFVYFLAGNFFIVALVAILLLTVLNIHYISVAFMFFNCDDKYFISQKKSYHYCFTLLFTLAFAFIFSFYDLDKVKNLVPRELNKIAYTKESKECSYRVIGSLGDYVFAVSNTIKGNIKIVSIDRFVAIHISNIATIEHHRTSQAPISKANC
ncbi:hypothetical protein [Vreelandella populi]|uniref:Uncharacterized protein n=1 Tax=Vreelandella populi TaxID=2498858 RepID=A0A433LCB9_9GAMM|nr:hypothetical protein [Halomonas populi]RUR46223.1 hypothetical protein ELY37_09545 [Halomonas populi]